MKMYGFTKNPVVKKIKWGGRVPPTLTVSGGNSPHFALSPHKVGGMNILAIVHLMTAHHFVLLRFAPTFFFRAGEVLKKRGFYRFCCFFDIIGYIHF